MFSISLSSESNDECIKNAYKKYKNKNVNEAFNQLKGCEESIIDSDDPKLIARYYHGLATCYRTLEDIDSALKYQNLSVSIKEKYGFDYALSDNYNELGLIYNRMGLYNKAIYYIYKSINLNKIDSPELLRLNYTNISECYEELGVLDSAIRYNLLTLNRIDLTEYSKAVIYNNLSDTYAKIGRIDKSLIYINEALSIKGINNRFRLKMLSTLNILKLKHNLDYESKPIVDYFQESGTFSDSMYSSFNLSILNLYEKKYSSSSEILESILTRLELKNHFNIAYKYTKEYLSVIDKLNIDTDNYFYLKEKETFYKTKIAINKNNIYQTDLNTKHLVQKQLSDLTIKLNKAEFNNHLLVGVLIFSFVLGNLTFFWYRKHRIVRFLSLSILKLKTENQNSNKFIINNLAKVMFVLHYKLDEEIDKEIFKALDESINELDNSNQQLSYYSNKLEEKYAKTESTL
jgi:tetratricopeptide (TPR) repeat protein